MGQEIESGSSSGAGSWREFEFGRRLGLQAAGVVAAGVGATSLLDISKAARSLVGRLGHTRWTPHDLRRTLVTQLYELGVDGDVARRISGHVGTDVHSSVYDRSRQLDKMRAALVEYEGFIFSCTAKLEKLSENNVIALRAS